MEEESKDDNVHGDKIIVGNIENVTGVAIGTGARAIINNIHNYIQQVLSAVDEAEKARLLVRQRLAEAVGEYAQRLLRLGSDKHDADQGGPYRGLHAYTLADTEIFFGRESALQELWERIHRNRLTILQSESGAGKSSLLQAGIAPQILIKGHLPVYFRPYDLSPSLKLKQTLFPALASVPELVNSSLRDFLSELTRILGSSTTLYVVVDQFEEFFALVSDEPTPEGIRPRSHFVNELAECLEDESLNVRWILSLRSEFFGDFANFRPRIRKPFDNDYRLNRLTSDEARSVIIKPALRHDLTIESQLVDAILADLKQPDGEIAPPQIQLVCLALYQAYREQVEKNPAQAKIITLALYDQEDRAKGILRRYLDRVLRQTLRSQEERELARRLLVELISSDQRRLRLSQSELLKRLTTAVQVSQSLDRTFLLTVLKELVDNNLLTTDKQYEDDETTYELAHDYLLGEIQVDPDVQARKAAQELLQREVESYRHYKTLLSKEKFDIINSQRALLVLNETAEQLLKQSEDVILKEQRDKEAARQRQLDEARANVRKIAMVLVVALIAFVVAILGWNLAGDRQIIAQDNAAIAVAESIRADANADDARQKQAQAERQTNIALSRQLVAESLNLLNTAPEQAIQLALKATTITTVMEEPAITALYRAEQSSRLQKLLTAHNQIGDVSYSLDGKYLASGDFDGNVTIWDLETDNPPLVLPRDGTELTSTKINRDGKYIYLTDITGSLEVWDLTTKQLLPGYPKSLHSEEAINDADLTVDGLFFVTTGEDSAARIIELATGEIIHEILLDGAGCGVAFNTDGSLVAIGDFDGNIYVWNILEQKTRHFKNADGYEEACAVAFSPDNEILATGGTEGIPKLWSLETNELLLRLAPHTDTIWRIVFSPDGKLLASAGFDNKVNIYDVSSGKLLQMLAGHTAPLRALAFAPNSEQLASVDKAGEIRLWDVSFGYHSGIVTKVLFSPDGDFFASASADGTIRVWDSSSEKLLQEIDMGGWVWEIDIHPNQSLIAGVSDKNVAQVWDIITGEQVSKFSIMAKRAGSVDYSPDGQWLAVGGDKGVFVWDTLSRNEVVFFSTPYQNYSVAFNPDGKSLAAVCADGIVRVWNLATKELKFPVIKHDDPDWEIFRAAFSPKGDLLATAGAGGLVNVWNAATGEFVAGIIDHTNSMRDVKFSPDGKFLATASSDRSAKVWDLSLAIENQTITDSFRTFQDFVWYVNSVAFSPDGREVVAAGADPVIRRYTLSLADLMEEVEDRLIALKKK